MAESLREVRATRYVLALREGGSLPGIVEADDLGTYVVKFRGAGQGRKALVAEVVVGELGRRLGLPVPELVVRRARPLDGQRRARRGGAGPAAGQPRRQPRHGLPARVAGHRAPRRRRPGARRPRRLVRRARRRTSTGPGATPTCCAGTATPWLIDHGAALYFHHDWTTRGRGSHPSLPDRGRPRPAPRRDGPRRRARGPRAVWSPPALLAEVARPRARRAGSTTSPGSPTPTTCVRPTSTSSPDACRDPGAWLDAVEVARAVRV